MIMDEAEGLLAQMSEEWNAVLASSTGGQAVLANWEQPSTRCGERPPLCAIRADGEAATVR